MSVVLKEEKRSEFPLVAFTACVSASEGLALCALVSGSGAGEAGVALLLTTAGMVASIGHLAKPLRAPRSLLNVRTSWLSREIAAVGLLWALIIAWLCFASASALAPAVSGGVPFALSAASFLANAASVIVGAALLFVIARAYQVSTRPAWCGNEGLMELWACALGFGPVAALACATAYGDVPPALCALAGVPVAGFVLDVRSHYARGLRLGRLVSESDERVSLTLVRYEALMPRMRKLQAAEAVCVVISAGVGVCAAVMGANGAWALCFAILSCVELAVHAGHRAVFYDLPVQVRSVKRLRK